MKSTSTLSLFSLLFASLLLTSCGSKREPPLAGAQVPNAEPASEDVARCAPLDTRADVSTGIKGKIDGSLDTLYKVAKANGDIEGAKVQVIHNLQQDVPIAGQDLIQIRAQYLFCAVWGVDPHIDPAKKAELYQAVVRLPNSASTINPPAPATTQAPPSEPPAQTEWIKASLPVPGCGQSGCYSSAKVCGPLPAGKKFTGNTRTYIDSFSGWGQWGDGPFTDGQAVCRWYIQHSHNIKRDVSFEYEVAE